MKKSQPIKSSNELDKFKNYYLNEKPQPRNHMFITMGLNTALRVSDLRKLQWNDVYDFKRNHVRTHLMLIEQKTQKRSVIFLNQKITSTLEWYKSLCKSTADKSAPLFLSNKGNAISRTTAYRIVKTAAKACDIDGVISPHSLRKTFGYQAWQKGTSPILLMDIYQHSSFDITKRYLGIEQDERDAVFRDIVI